MIGPIVVVAVFALLCLVFSSCTMLFYRSIECTDLADAATPTVSNATVSGDTWLYQLQDADPVAVATTDFDIVVMDYSADGSSETAYSAVDISTIATDGRSRTVLAYFSIGEAEDYRWYFDGSWTNPITGQPDKDAPCWLGRTNPEWRGNYKVQYWSAAWQDYVLLYLDEIIAAGFDGVYLDIVDAYEYWADEDNRESFVLTEREAADRMINLVMVIAEHGRETDPGFLIFPQNGEPILEYDDGEGSFAAGAYLAAIDGIGIEDLYYDETKVIDSSTTDYRLGYLRTIRDAGKPVLVVDYVDDGSGSAKNDERMDLFHALCAGEGFLSYAAFADRALDSIN